MKKLKESAMAELDIAAQEAPTFEAFVKTVKQEFPQLASDLNKPEVISFLQNMYDDAKMRENKTTMKKSQLEQLIREEIKKALNEGGTGIAENMWVKELVGKKIIKAFVKTSGPDLIIWCEDGSQYTLKTVAGLVKWANI